MTGQKNPYCYRLETAGLGLSFQTSKPTVGEARQSGNSAVAAGFYVYIENTLAFISFAPQLFCYTNGET